jgi:hypothetical protein
MPCSIEIISMLFLCVHEENGNDDDRFMVRPSEIEIKTWFAMKVKTCVDILHSLLPHHLLARNERREKSGCCCLVAF